MSKMTKQTKITYHVEGTDWNTDVELDAEIFETEKEQIFEAATRALEIRMADNEELSIGAIILVKKQRSPKEAMVNAYICLNNAGKYKLAEELRENFKKSSGGQDLALDETGYSY